jgi:hypothetical protein
MVLKTQVLLPLKLACNLAGSACASLHSVKQLQQNI